MFTKNFYRALQRTFFRTGVYQTTPDTMPKNYSGTENVSETGTWIENIGRYSFGTGSSNVNAPIMCGIADDIADEQAFIESNGRKQSTQGDGELNNNVLNSREWGTVFMIVGSGTTAPTKNDYKLESFIGSDVLQATFCGLSVTENLDTDDAIDVITKSWTFQNVSDSPVTVSEIGLVAKIVNDYSSIRNYLLYREVLTNSVTIQPGGKYTFEVNLTIK